MTQAVHPADDAKDDRHELRKNEERFDKLNQETNPAKNVKAD
jgi:hypothetical protein